MPGTRHLQQFVAVAEELSFRRAAQRLHMSQPPLTQAIHRLEAAMGVQLFERTRAYVRLTPAGEVLLAHARRSLQQTTSMLEAVRQAQLGLSGSLSVSFVPSASLLMLPPVVQAFRTRCPDVALELFGDTTANQLLALEQERVQVSIVVGPLPRAPHLDVTPLHRSSLVAAVPVTHRLADRERVRLRELANEPFVMLPMAQSPAYTAAILMACQGAGFTPRVAQEAAPVQTILALVGCGVGVSLVPASMRVLALPTVRYLSVMDKPAPAYELAVARLAGPRNVLVDRFIETARAISVHAGRAGSGQHTTARLSRRGSQAAR